MSNKRRQYTREFKLEALRLWQTSEKSAVEIHGWFSKGFYTADLREVKAQPEELS